MNNGKFSLAMMFVPQVSKWGEKIAGLVVVEPGISTASFKEWSEGKVTTRWFFVLLITIKTQV